MPDTVALLHHLKEIGSAKHPLSSNTTHLRDIWDPLSWATCFMTFVAGKTNLQESRELIAYGKIIIYLVQGHGA